MVTLKVLTVADKFASVIRQIRKEASERRIREDEMVRRMRAAVQEFSGILSEEEIYGVLKAIAAEFPRRGSFT